MTLLSRPILRAALAGASLLTLAACEQDGSFDYDLRHFGQGGFDTTTAARSAAPRPAADDRGIISYPTYQVAVARQGDTVDSVAARVGIPATDLARHNAIAPGTPLRKDEVLVLPVRVAAAAAILPGAAPAGGGSIDVATIAGGAIDRVEAGRIPSAPAAAAAPKGTEPVRHQVVRGETAYSIARLYNVDVRALADWNGLGSDLAVREGQFLMIPVGVAAAPAPSQTAPGQGSPTPTPPSAAKPLPAEKATPAVAKPASPDLGATKTASSSKLGMPVDGKIIRGYQKKKNDGIDIAAAAGTTVKAAGDGTVAAIMRDTESVQIVVVRHEGNLLTVYANVDSIAVAKGDKVKRGQAIAKVRAADPSFVRFEVRQGIESVDPMPYLQ